MVNKFNFKSILIVISSPSGAGKTSLAKAIVKENKTQRSNGSTNVRRKYRYETSSPDCI